MTDGVDPGPDDVELAEGRVLDVFGDLLLRGVTLDAGLRALLAGAVADALDVAGLGIEAEVHQWIGLFERDPEARLVMTLARQAGVPYSEARRRWSDVEDVAAELAWNATQAAESWARCPSCGIDPADVVGENGRPLPFGRWKIVGSTCFVCSTLRKLREGLGDEEKDREYRVVPRGDGDPFLEE